MRARCTAGALGALIALATLAPRAAAQESVFGIRGIGFLGRPVSARAAGTGGAFAPFDAAGAGNPATLGRWRTMVGWAVGVPTRRTVAGPAGDLKLTGTRFPLFGFATLPSERLVVGVTVSEYLSRTWGVRDSLDVDLGGVPQPVIDVKSSVGGVSDLRLGAAYHLGPRVDVGVAFHALSGSARTTVVRDFADTSFTDFVAAAVTEFTGRAVSLGVTAEVVPRVLLSGSLRLNSRLTSKKSDGVKASVALPTEAGFGLVVSPARGVSLAASAAYAGWSSAAGDMVAAGEEPSRDVWSVGVGTEFETVRRGAARIPVRLGYRWRELPFPVQGELVGESAISGGFALDLAGGRTTIDFAFERGSRSAAGQRERFLSGFLGVILRP